jgi:phenylpropionate dioxygenase-like ring-hydroxylating dioxygenase large terminal subunit
MALKACAERPITADDILETGLLNQWYLVCRASDVAAKPIRLTRLGRNIALWRDPGGALHAVEDFCPHRGARLSMGHVLDDGLACAYHGIVVNGSGVVRAVPPVSDCPMVGKKAIIGYPVREAAGAIFLYFSDGISEHVPQFELPPELLSDEWSGFLHTAEWNCHYSLPLDNRFDPMHASYLHAHSFTLAYGLKQSTILLSETPHGFVIERDNQRGVNQDGGEAIYKPGNNMWGMTDVPYPRCVGGNFFRVIGHFTPIDAERTYFWLYRCQKSSGWRRDMWHFLYKNRLNGRHLHVLDQDQAMLEGIARDRRDREILIQSDIGIARVRRMMRLEAEEQARRINEHRAAGKATVP